MKRRVRPYKIELKSWKMLPSAEPKFNENGREMLRMAIAEEQEQDGSNHKYIYEDIYKDVLRTLFTEKQDYKVLNNYGKNPPILIVCDNDIIPHNPMVSELIQLIRDKLELFDKTELINCYIDMMQTRKKRSKKSKMERDFYERLNADTNKISHDLIYYTLYDYILDDIRSKDTRSFREQMKNNEQFKAEVLKAYYENDTQTLDKIKESLLYRYLLGQ